MDGAEVAERVSRLTPGDLHKLRQEAARGYPPSVGFYVAWCLYDRLLRKLKDAAVTKVKLGILLDHISVKVLPTNG